MKIKLVFEDWKNSIGKSIYATDEGIKLSMGDFHSGSTFGGEIYLELEQKQDLLSAIKCGGIPVFRLYLPDLPVESMKAEFGRRMKMPNTGTEPKEGTGFGDLPYAPWEK